MMPCLGGARATRETTVNLQMRHRRLMKEHADPADEFDFQALKVALQILAAVLVGLFVSLMTDGGEPAITAPGASDQARNHASIQRTTLPSGENHAQG
jgi:hypothetical protein